MSELSPGPLLEARALSKQFGGLLANDQINLAVYGGEVHAILGENGAGKSTLMKSLYGFHRPTSGEISVDGAPVEIDSPHEGRALGSSIQDGSWKSEHIRGGIESDFVGLAPYGPSVDEATQKLIADAKAKLIDGELKIFKGPIPDNAGTVRIPEGEAGGIDLLDTTDWLIEGVIKQSN